MEIPEIVIKTIVIVYRYKMLASGLIVVSVLLFIAGGTAVGLGVYNYIKSETLGPLSKLKNITTISIDNYDDIEIIELGTILRVVGGAPLLVIGVLICCAVMKKAKCLLGTVFVILVFLLTGEAVATILAIKYKDEVIEKLQNKLKWGVKTLYGGENPKIDNSFSTAFDFGQVRIFCKMAKAI